MCPGCKKYEEQLKEAWEKILYLDDRVSSLILLLGEEALNDPTENNQHGC